ncbi:MAG: hypothetical protein ACLVML_00760 [Candidatus Gastranaerophilaceae bacterium]|nr:phage tail family protein [Christensenellales bacterium]
MNENTVVIYENALGKLEFRHESAFWISDISGASSVDVDIAESRSAMQIGSSIEGQIVQPRSITIDGAIFEPLAANRKRLIDIMSPQVPSILTVIGNGESWYLDVVPERTPDITPGNGVQMFQLRLRAAYPYWRTTASYAAQVTGISPLFRFPFSTGGTWWISRFSDNFFATVTNQGNIATGFRAIFVARSALSNPELHHVDSGKRILIRKSMAAGDMITVSTVHGSKGVVCTSAAGGVTNGFRYLSADSNLSMSLLPGPNLLRVDAGVNREGLSARIEAPMGVRSGV